MTSHTPIALACAFAALVADLTAQSVTLPMNPRATYLRTNNDAPLPPLVVDLATLSASPGTWLRLESTGAFRYISGGQDDHRSMCGVFSSSPTLLATSLQQRVPNAIQAGPTFASGGTYYGSLPMDIAEDFFISRQGWATAVLVEVPPGATHLFLGVHDSLYNDNVDPNLDYAAILTVLATPPLPGTGEHIELRSGVGTTPTALPADRLAPANATLAIELHHPVGFVEGALYVIAVDLAPTGGPVPSLLPRVWLGAHAVVAQLGVIPATPGWFAAWSSVAPPGLLGTSLIVQGGALSPLSRNGLYETTIAHRFAFQ